VFSSNLSYWRKSCFFLSKLIDPNIQKCLCEPVTATIGLEFSSIYAFLTRESKKKNDSSSEFRGSEPSGNFTIRHKTLSEIAAELKNGNALHEYGLDIAITAQIKGFEKAGSLVKLSRIQT
jgi:hypothetical protein